MGEIRSAIDIALEKTAHIEGDKASSEHRELKNVGKRAASEFLETENAETFSKSLAEKDAERSKAVLEGALSILIAGVKLPSAETDLARSNRIGAALELALPGRGMLQLFAQVAQILKQYLDERSHLREALEQQFAPKLKAKQQEMSRRYGQNVPMDLNQDPEFVSAYSKSVRMMEQKYGTIVDEIRFRVKEAAGIAEE